MKNITFPDGYVRFKDNSFMLAVSLIVEVGDTLSLFSGAGTYLGDFLKCEIKSYQ